MAEFKSKLFEIKKKKYKKYIHEQSNVVRGFLYLARKVLNH